MTTIDDTAFEQHIKHARRLRKAEEPARVYDSEQVFDR